MAHRRATTAAILTVIGVLFVSQAAFSQPPMGQPRATAQAVLRDGTGAQIGLVYFTQSTSQRVRVEVSAGRLSPGFHGFHVHDIGVCTAPGFTSAGGHYNPGGGSHRDHSGDLPLLFAQPDGVVKQEFTVDRFTAEELLTADTAVVIHANADNYANIPSTDAQAADGTFTQRAYYHDADSATEGIQASPGPAADTTLRTGDAGGRIACGVVERAPSPSPTPVPTPPVEQSRAEAKLVDANGASLGTVLLIQANSTYDRIRVFTDLSGLPPGFHGFHVHDVGVCTGPGFTSAGGHYNPGAASHRDHSGDMPVLFVAQDGTASSGLWNPRFSVDELIAADVAIVVHAAADNYANIPSTDVQNPDGTFSQRAYYYDADPASGLQPTPGAAPDTTLRTGDAGARIGCGVVRSLATTSPSPSRSTGPPPTASAIPSPSSSTTGPPASPSPTPSPTETAGPQCPGFEGDGRNHVVGDSGENVLRGTSGADIICGLGLNDTLIGRGGNDLLIGGSGNDLLRGRSGNDSLRGGRGADLLNGGPGRDSCRGGGGRDIERNCER